jgi:putative DNA primase/helicase
VWRWRRLPAAAGRAEAVIPEAAKEVGRVVGSVAAGPIARARTEESKVRAVQRVWVETQEVARGDPVWRYLNRRLDINQVPTGLRLHPGLRYTDENGRDLGSYPAMLAKIRYPDGAGASIHRTYVTDDGAKAPVPQPKKIMAGKPLNTGRCEARKGSDVGISEGLETALAASTRFCVPVWAATNATLLESWVPPAGVDRVLIAGDNDASYTGQSAAFNLAKRLVRDGYAIEIQIPGQTGKDWADEGV